MKKKQNQTKNTEKAKTTKAENQTQINRPKATQTKYKSNSH